MTGTIVAFGEILLRYSPPGREQLFQTPRLESGGAASLRRAVHDGLAVSVLKHSMAGDAAPLRASDLARFHGGGIDVRR